MASNYSNMAPNNPNSYNDPEGTHGPHNSRIANTLDPRVDSDRDHRAAPAMTGTSGAGVPTAYGPSAGTTGYNAPQGSQGPHNSKIANTLDPRVDSDNDHRAKPPHATNLETGGSYGVGGSAGAGHPAATHSAGENTGERVARNIKGVFAQAHGIGESLRGNINSGVDSLIGDKSKQTRDEDTARRGYHEFANRELDKTGNVDSGRRI